MCDQGADLLSGTFIVAGRGLGPRVEDVTLDSITLALLIVLASPVFAYH